jgi:hypothetical protein
MLPRLDFRLELECRPRLQRIGTRTCHWMRDARTNDARDSLPPRRLHPDSPTRGSGASSADRSMRKDEYTPHIEWARTMSMCRHQPCGATSRDGYLLKQYVISFFHKYTVLELTRTSHMRRIEVERGVCKEVIVVFVGDAPPIARRTEPLGLEPPIHQLTDSPTDH